MDWDWNDPCGAGGVPTTRGLYDSLHADPTANYIRFSAEIREHSATINKHSITLIESQNLKEAFFSELGLKTVEHAAFLVKALAGEEFPACLNQTEDQGGRSILADAQQLSRLISRLLDEVPGSKHHPSRCELVAHVIARIGWECAVALDSRPHVQLSKDDRPRSSRQVSIRFASADFVAATVLKPPEGQYYRISKIHPFGWSSELGTKATWRWVETEEPPFDDKMEPKERQTTFLALPGFYESTGPNCVAAISFRKNHSPRILPCQRTLCRTLDSPNLKDGNYELCRNLAHYTAFNYRAYLLLKTREFETRYFAEDARCSHCLILTVPVALSSIRAQHEIFAIFATIAITNASDEQVKRLAERLAFHIGELQVTALRALGDEIVKELDQQLASTSVAHQGALAAEKAAAESARSAEADRAQLQNELSEAGIKIEAILKGVRERLDTNMGGNLRRWMPTLVELFETDHEFKRFGCGVIGSHNPDERWPDLMAAGLLAFADAPDARHLDAGVSDADRSLLGRDVVAKYKKGELGEYWKKWSLLVDPTSYPRLKVLSRLGLVGDLSPAMFETEGDLRDHMQNGWKEIQNLAEAPILNFAILEWAIGALLVRGEHKKDSVRLLSVELRNHILTGLHGLVTDLLDATTVNPPLTLNKKYDPGQKTLAVCVSHCLSGYDTPLITHDGVKRLFGRAIDENQHLRRNDNTATWCLVTSLGLDPVKAEWRRHLIPDMATMSLTSRSEDEHVIARAYWDDGLWIEYRNE